MKYNYPIRYAVMPVYSEACWDNNYEPEIEFYTVSKCFLVGEKIKFYINGTKKKN